MPFSQTAGGLFSLGPGLFQFTQVGDGLNNPNDTGTSRPVLWRTKHSTAPQLIPLKAAHFFISPGPLMPRQVEKPMNLQGFAMASLAEIPVICAIELFQKITLPVISRAKIPSGIMSRSCLRTGWFSILSKGGFIMQVLVILAFSLLPAAGLTESAGNGLTLTFRKLNIFYFTLKENILCFISLTIYNYK